MKLHLRHTAPQRILFKGLFSLRSKEKTIVLIAHRFKRTVLNADKIVVMEEEKVVEEGSHTELFKKEGKYYKLWQHQ